MARLSNTILSADQAFAVGSKTPMVDPSLGGPFGFMPDYTQYVSNAQYVRRNIVARLIEAPRGFNDLPAGKEKFYATLKAVVEMWPKTIDGLKSTLNVSHEETPYGRAGEMMQQVSNVTRERSEPSFSFTELYGRPLTAFFNAWVTLFLMDPETGTPMISSLANKPVDLLPDYTGMTVLFYEPDPTYTKVLNAWLCTNMMPTGQMVPIEGKKEPTSPGEQLDFTIQFTAITQHGPGPREFAQRLLDATTLTGANPATRPAYISEISADVKASENGIADTMAQAARTAVQPT